MKKVLKTLLTTLVGMIIGTVVSFLLMFLVVIVLIKGVQHAQIEPILNNSILHIKVRGVVVEKHRPLDLEFIATRNLFVEDHTLGLFELGRAIELAKQDARVKGIYVELREFSAGWAALTSLHRHLKDFADSGKWVYVYGDHMDEKGYYLASAATRVYLEPHGDLELNGLAVSEAFVKGMFDKLELEPKIFRVGRFKAAVEPLIRDKMSEENRAQNQALLDDIWVDIRTRVAQLTKFDEARIDEIVTHMEAASADQAKKLGLVTDLMFEDEVEDLMRDNTVGKDKEIELVTPGQLLREQKPKALGKAKKIALIFAEGDIESGPGGSESIGSEGLRQELVDVKADKNVAAVVLRVNSPGGDALASDVIWRELMITDEEIPVVTSMGDVAASGGYYIASAARHIFAEPTTITGSIGVFGVLFNSEKFFRNKAGVSFDRVVTHPHADIGNSNRPMTKDEAAIIQSDVERVYKRFLDVVQESRGYEKREDLESLAEGRVWSGLRAKEIGLVDELGGLNQAIAKAAELAQLGKDYEIEIFPKEVDPLTRLVEQFSGDMLSKVFGTESVAAIQRLGEIAKRIPAQARKLRSHIQVQARMPADLHIE